MSLLKKIQEYGYQDWVALATAIKKAGLGVSVPKLRQFKTRDIF